VKPIVLLCPRIPPSRDGVGDYTVFLAAELAKTRPVTIVTTQQQLPDPAGSDRIEIHRWDGKPETLLHLLAAIQPELVNIQWVPGLWARLGFNPALPSLVMRLRWAGYRVLTTVHETYVGFDHWKHFLVGPLQRLTLWPLVMASSKVAAASQSYVSGMRRVVPWRSDDVFWMPVGSNVPMMQMPPEGRGASRHAMGIPEDALVVAAFSPFAAGKDAALLEASWNRVCADHPNAHLLLIGVTPEAAAARLPNLAAVDRLTCTGYLPRTEVSHCLSQADIFIAPFRNGMSCKRGSVMAALQHGLAVVTTRGAMTEPQVFDAAPMVMTDADAPETYIEACAALAEDHDTRSRLGAEAGVFYRRQFDWPVLAHTLAAHCLNGGK
jgi:glycosyltransferase involved in cell wall biosynthesis